jgi:hypothetical protein
MARSVAPRGPNIFRMIILPDVRRPSLIRREGSSFMSKGTILTLIKKFKRTMEQVVESIAKF